MTRTKANLPEGWMVKRLMMGPGMGEPGIGFHFRPTGNEVTRNGEILSGNKSQ